jgi:hypothetical protein
MWSDLEYLQDVVTIWGGGLWSQILTILLEVIETAGLLAFDWDGGQGPECIQFRPEEDVDNTQSRSTNEPRLSRVGPTFHAIGSEILVSSLYSQLVALAISLRHLPGSMISLCHLFLAGRFHRYGRVIRIHGSEPLLLSRRYTN